MANNFYLIAAPDAHIDFLASHSENLEQYIAGERPFGGPGVPVDWPTQQARPIGPSNAIDRNVGLYHWILNGQEEFVEGSGTIFQTWLTNQHSAIDLSGGANESFAFKSNQVPALIGLVQRVDERGVQSAFSGWLQRHGENTAVTAEECRAFVEEFSKFSTKLEEAVGKNIGLVWIPG